METVIVFRTTALECWQHKLEGIHRFADTHGWRLQVIDGDITATQAMGLLDFWEAVGCIVEADGGDTKLRPKHFRRTPVVFLDHSPDITREGASVVRHDSAQIARVAAKELLRLNFSDYALVGWFSQAYWMLDKLEAFKSVLELHGKRVHVFEPEAGDRGGSTALQRHLRSWLRKLPKPCGVFGVNDYIAERALSAAVALGYSIPEELAFVGADNDEIICETTRPSMTSVLPDFKTTGYMAAELLANKIDDPAAPAVLRVIPPLGIVRRQSMRLFKRSDACVQAAMELVRRKAADGLKARDVLATFPCSRRQAEIRFRSLTGHSVLEEIQEVRFARAMDMLSSPNIAIGAIAGRSGWPSEVVLERYVKKRTGKTLSEHRKAMRSGQRG
ncbi:MAG TPA: substrate-binding domain-containing protein [Kiritimatiellia bacterium]|nr:substrate-binding domain-containing protein [Kiritimatiellia bacterium]HRU70289.1 substrate-binding domain-containing protein [Kiritimatiellia bacterium]